MIRCSIQGDPCRWLWRAREGISASDLRGGWGAQAAALCPVSMLLLGAPACPTHSTSSKQLEW